MKRTIFIYIGPISPQGVLPGEVNWLVQGMDSPDGLVFSGNLATAANHALGCRVVVLLASSDMLLMTAPLPAMNRQRLLKAIPFSLEEQLASEVDELHFALGERVDDNAVNCCVIERGILDGLQRELKTAGIQPDVVTSELFGIPYDINGWSIWLSNTERAIVRTADQSGVMLDIGNADVLLTHNLQGMDEAQRPTQLRIYAGQDRIDALTVVQGESDTADITEFDALDSGLTGASEVLSDEALSPASNSQGQAFNELRHTCEELGLEYQEHDYQQASLAVMVENYDEQRSINLLQGDYSRKEQFEKLLRPWIPAAAVAVIWLLLQLGLLVGEFYQLSNTKKQLRTEIVAVYQQAFPESKNIVDPKVQMERGLKKLRGDGGASSDLLTLLAKAGEVLKDTKEMTIRSIRFKDSKLDLDLEISDLQALDKLKLRLTKEAKLKVDIVSASARDGKVESRLKIQAEKS